jgi:hypothetical protein
MCNQVVGLVAGELEWRGISTVCIELLREVAEAVCPPRSLFVPFDHGHPLGRLHDAGMQHAVIEAALTLLERTDAEPPLLVDYEA